MPETITGEIEHISFYNAENDYTVARLRVVETDEQVTVVGHLSGVRPGERLRLTGLWKNHPRFGRQFAVESFEFIYPETVEGIEKYLGSGLIKGIGPKTAQKIVARFGRETLEIIEKEPKRLGEISGLGGKRLAGILESWNIQRGLRRVMVFLQSYGVGGALAARIYRQYRERSIEVVMQNPYRLAEEVHGIGFATADRIARNLGFAHDHHLRISSGLIYAAELSQEKGHTCLPREYFLKRASQLLGLPVENLEPSFSALVQTGKIILEKDSASGNEYVYSSFCFWAETIAAERMARIILEKRSHLFSSLELDERYEALFEMFEKEKGIELSEEQKKAVIGALEKGFAVITGGPGTGKTTVIAALDSLLDGKDLKIVLAAPTGRAAKRMSETTGSPSSTIHRLLGWSFNEGKFLHHAGRPLEGDIFVVDEASMVDLPLFASLLEALPEGAALILVGDVDQLPSIGPGKVLSDLIASRAIPVFRLNEIFRQARTSLIIQNAHRVREGKLPVSAEALNQLSNQEKEGNFSRTKADFFFVDQPDPVKARDLVVRLAAERLEARYGLSPLNDLQVITPMNRGACGTRELNARLQEALNPEGKRIPFSARDLRIGDRVMQVRNDYEKDVFNGDVGRVLGFDAEGLTMSVDFDGRVIEYGPLELDDLVIAYAVTVHKSQGCEYPAVILTILNEHYVMLQRNLLYTAISRGKELVVLVGDPKAVALAVENAKEQFRYSRLAVRLLSLIK